MVTKQQPDNTPFWDEETSEHFITLGRVYTPRRDEILETFLDLIPAEPDEPFTGAELGTGAGWLTEGILKRFPNARMIGLDGSEAMRQTTSRLLAPFGERFDVRPFQLEEQAWRDALPIGLRVVVSSLVVHHLDGPGKQTLFRDLHGKLESGGALLICDVVRATSEPGRRAMARAWDAEVERQSLEILGDRSAFDAFQIDEWNMYAFPPPAGDIDHPSTLREQLRWLEETGFTGIDAWWVRAGHAIFGGYRT